MKTMSEHRDLSQAELIEEARQRFGDDPKLWAFRCPSCRDVASLADFLAAGADPNRAGQECIGRSLGALTKPAGVHGRNRNGRGCDWVAYGLIRGPWAVTVPADGDRPERTVHSFPLAGTDTLTEGP